MSQRLALVRLYINVVYLGRRGTSCFDMGRPPNGLTILKLLKYKWAIPENSYTPPWRKLMCPEGKFDL